MRPLRSVFPAWFSGFFSTTEVLDWAGDEEFLYLAFDEVQDEIFDDHVGVDRQWTNSPW